MTGAVIDGSGRTGQDVVRHAHTVGHHARVLVREPSRAPAARATSDVVTGDPISRGAVAEPLDAADAATSALGLRMGGPTNALCSTATGRVVDVASNRSRFRYVVVSAAGMRGPANDTAVPFRIPSMIVRAPLGATTAETSTPRPRHSRTARSNGSCFDRPGLLTGWPGATSVRTQPPPAQGGSRATMSPISPSKGLPKARTSVTRRSSRTGEH
jgi:hypothetical protein